MRAAADDSSCGSSIITAIGLYHESAFKIGYCHALGNAASVPRGTFSIVVVLEGYMICHEFWIIYFLLQNKVENVRRFEYRTYMLKYMRR